MVQERTISQFRGNYHFLSNFYPAEVEMDGEKYPTVEHAFQAAKFPDDGTRRVIRMASSPSRAKALGRNGRGLRADWEQVKVNIMLDLLRKKFADPELAERLLATGDDYLVEGNNWGDTFWGAVNGKGQNLLGTLLTIVRIELKDKRG